MLQIGVSEQPTTKILLAGSSQIREFLIFLSQACGLINFMSLISFDASSKHQKTRGFLAFSGRIEMEILG